MKLELQKKKVEKLGFRVLSLAAITKKWQERVKEVRSYEGEEYDLQLKKDVVAFAVNKRGNAALVQKMLNFPDDTYIYNFKVSLGILTPNYAKKESKKAA